MKVLLVNERLSTFLTFVVFVFLYQVITGGGLELVKHDSEIFSPIVAVSGVPDTEMSCGPSEKQLLKKKCSNVFLLTSNVELHLVLRNSNRVRNLTA